MEARRKFLKQMLVATTAIGSVPLVLQGSTNIPFTGDSSSKLFLNACREGNILMVRNMLTKDKALLLARDELGRSGFAIALLAGYKEVANELAKFGFKSDLHETVLNQHWERFDKLIGEESESTQNIVNSDHPIGGSLMWAAAAGGAGIDMWRIYAKCGDPNIAPKNAKGTTPVQIALRFPNLLVAERTCAALLSNNADVDPIDNADLPPIHIASERGSLMMVEMLIRLGADVNRTDRNGQLPIQVAEKFGQEHVFKLLQDHHQIPRTCRTSRMAFNADGEKYEAPDFEDIPLFLRRKLVGQAHGNFEYVKKAVGADSRMAHCVATTSEVCVEACAHIGRKPIVEYLVKNGAPYSLPTAVMLNDFTTVKKLLDEDPNRIEERGAHDFGLLWYPIIGQCDVEMALLLIDRGANVEHQHFMGTTALHWACLRDRLDIAELLVENGANVNRVGYKFKTEGETPLQSSENDTITKFLKSKGAQL